MENPIKILKKKEYLFYYILFYVSILVRISLLLYFVLCFNPGESIPFIIFCSMLQSWWEYLFYYILSFLIVTILVECRFYCIIQRSPKFAYVRIAVRLFLAYARYFIKGKLQGWEFDHRFFDRINRFLWSKDRLDREKDRITRIQIQYTRTLFKGW